MKLVFVIGPTNAGKSTLIEAAKLRPGYACVEVGKAMRAKYPPEYFKGQGAPKHTAVEAWNIMLDGVHAAESAGKAWCLIDGQPRDIQQCLDALALPFDKKFLHLWAPKETLIDRVHRRDVADPERLKLSLARVDSDAAPLYEVTSMLQAAGASIVFFDTSRVSYSLVPVFTAIEVPRY